MNQINLCLERIENSVRALRIDMGVLVCQQLLLPSTKINFITIDV